MNSYLFILFFSIVITTASQVKEPKEDHYGCTYLEEPNYIVNKESVFFENCSMHRKVDVNPKELRVMGAGLAFSTNNMFYNGIRLNVRPNSPKIIRTDDASVYWINTEFLFRNEVEISKIDTLTFTALNGGYFKDKDKVYFNDKILKNVDPAFFVYNYPYGYDKNSVYSGINKVKIDGNLQSVNGYYFKDNTTVYQYNSSFLFDLEPRYNINIQNVIPIPKTKYGVVNDTLYYLERKTTHDNIDITKIKFFSNDIIGFDNKIIYRGIATEEFDFSSTEVLASTGYYCLLKDENGSYELTIKSDELIVKPYKSIPKRKKEPKLYSTIAPLQMVNDTLNRRDYPLVKKSFLKQGGMTNFETIELVSILKGYRMGCSRDTQSASNYYILKNNQGYWELIISSKNTLNFIGKTYKF